MFNFVMPTSIDGAHCTLHGYINREQETRLTHMEREGIIIRLVDDTIHAYRDKYDMMLPFEITRISSSEMIATNSKLIRTVIPYPNFESELGSYLEREVKDLITGMIAEIANKLFDEANHAELTNEQAESIFRTRVDEKFIDVLGVSTDNLNKLLGIQSL